MDSSPRYPEPDAIVVLRDAVRRSPANPELRLHLAEALLTHHRADEAEREYRAGLDLDSHHERLKLGLAQCFYVQKRFPESLVLVEDLLERPGEASQRTAILHIRLLIGTNQFEAARQAFRRALRRYPSLVETELAESPFVSPEDLSFPEQGDMTSFFAAESPPVTRLFPAEENQDVDEADITSSTVDFQDVGGMDELKEAIRLKIVYPALHADLYEAYGKKAGGGLLLFGPPGCGKTLLARATAGEVRGGFINVGPGDVLDMWMGQSERNLHDLFEQARIHRPCILFFDEVEALGASRGGQRRSGMRPVVSQFLTELDGVDSDNEGILVLAATSAPWHLDPALRRPGRFDRFLFVPPPDLAARRSILEILLRDRPVEIDEDGRLLVDLEEIAARTAEFSGADLYALVDTAVERKLGRAIQSGRAEPLSTHDLLDALGRVMPSCREWFAAVRQHAALAEPGGIYDEVLRYLNNSRSSI